MNPPITQITHYMWLPHTGCGNRIQDAERHILYAVTPYLVDSHPICGARIQYTAPAYSMRDRIQYAAPASSMWAWDQGKFTGVLAAHCSLLAARCSLLAARCLMLAISCSLLAARSACCLLLAARCLLFAVLLLAARCPACYYRHLG